MAHIHPVKDTDVHYKIDAVSRVIVNVDETKRMLVQNDHNSERLTFEVPRYVDGHDLADCNVVQIHYVNSDMFEKNKSVGVYEVDDVGIKGTEGENANIVILTWLVSGNATRFVGNLDFVIRFSCVTENAVDYAWNTAVFKGISIIAGIYNSDVVVEEYADVLEQWRQELFGPEGDSKMSANWNANSDEPGHVLNRTHWVEGGTVEILPETVLDMTTGDTSLPNNIGLEAGKEYTVMWKGTSYTCTAFIVEENGMPAVCLGDMDGDDTHTYPFYVIEVPANMVDVVGFAVIIGCWDQGMIPMAIYTDGEIVHTLDPKYIKDMYYQEGGDGNPVSTITFDGNIEGKEFINMGSSDNPVYLVKVSDAYVDSSKIIGVQATMISNVEGMPNGTYPIVEEMIMDMTFMTGVPAYMIHDNGEPCGFLLSEDVTMEGETATKGIYFLCIPDVIYVSALTANSPIFVGGGKIHKIKNKYLNLGWIPEKLGETCVCPETEIGSYAVTFEGLKYNDVYDGMPVIIVFDGVRYNCRTWCIEGSAWVFGGDLLSGNITSPVMLNVYGTYTRASMYQSDGETHTFSVFVENYSKIPVEYMQDAVFIDNRNDGTQVNGDAASNALRKGIPAFYDYGYVFGAHGSDTSSRFIAYANYNGLWMHYNYSKCRAIMNRVSETLKPGQILEVAPPTTPGKYPSDYVSFPVVKGVDFPNADFDQNDATKKDYIKNRPFYEEVVETTIVKEGNFSVTSSDWGDAVNIYFAIPLKEGKEYRVTWNSVDYTYTAKKLYINDFYYGIALGDFTFVETGEKGETFLIVNLSDEAMAQAGENVKAVVWVFDGSARVVFTIAQLETVLHSINPKFLPEGYPLTNEVVVVPETELTFEPQSDFGGVLGAILFFEDAKPDIYGTTIINYNGVDYRCSALIPGCGGEGYFGNLGAMPDEFPGMPDTGEPFIALWSTGENDMWGIMPLENISTATFSVRKEVADPMDYRYVKIPAIDLHAMGVTASGTDVSETVVGQEVIKWFKKAHEFGLAKITIGVNGYNPREYVATAGDQGSCEFVINDFDRVFRIVYGMTNKSIRASVRKVTLTTFTGTG